MRCVCTIILILVHTITKAYSNCSCSLDIKNTYSQKIALFRFVFVAPVHVLLCKQKYKNIFYSFYGKRVNKWCNWTKWHQLFPCVSENTKLEEVEISEYTVRAQNKLVWQIQIRFLVIRKFISWHLRTSHPVLSACQRWQAI